jgi:hypothetical protein
MPRKAWSVGVMEFWRDGEEASSVPAIQYSWIRREVSNC